MRYGNIQDVYRRLQAEFDALVYFATPDKLSKLEPFCSGNIWESIRVLERNIAILTGSSLR